MLAMELNSSPSVETGTAEGFQTAWLTLKMLPLGHILLDVEIASVDDLYAQIARLVSRPHGPTERQVSDRLCRRHARSSPVYHQGLALPHAAIPALMSPTACYLRLSRPLALPEGMLLRDALCLLVPLPGLARDHDLLTQLRIALSSVRRVQVLRGLPSAAAIQAFLLGNAER
jgi:mannitol/fructose-specific phosphotransferase system IIA component (Ntr-type)